MEPAAAAEQSADRMQAEGAPQGIQDASKPYTFSAQVTYGSPEEATMVMNALAVDPELRPEAVTRQLSVDGSALVLNFAAVDMRTLRAAVGTFCDLLGLATRTLEAFGPSASPAAADNAAVAAAAAAAAEQQQ